MNEGLLLGARISAALLAGIYVAFAVAVMPALRGLDDTAFTDAMNRINVSIVNPAFLLIFFAAPALAAVIALLVRSPVGWVAAALGAATLLITIAINVPLNDLLAHGGTRAAFEDRWTLFNTLRTVTGTASLILLLLVRQIPGQG